MAFNGSGTFVRIYSWATDLINLVKITASRMDTEMDGFATGLSTAVTKDGQTTTTAMIPFAAGLKASDGTGAAPSITFTNDTDCGLYRIGTNNIGITVAGAAVINVATTGIGVTGGALFTGNVTGVVGTFSGGVSATTGAFSGAVSGTTGTFTGILAGTNGIASALDKPIYLYSASASNTAYWVADTATGNVRLVTGTSAPVTRITVAADSGNVTIATGTLTVSAAIASGAGLSGTSGSFSTAVTVGTTLGVTGVTTLSAGLIGTTGVFSSSVTCSFPIVTSAAPILASTATMTNFAAGGAGTLTNAPTAGNPTKWVAISDNGTTRYIPTWT